MLTAALTGPTLDRLVVMAQAYDIEPDVMLARLLDRDQHDHPHRCPTCARHAAREHLRLLADEQPSLFVG